MEHTPITIGIYPRKSVYRDNSESVSTQVKLCKEYANILYRDRQINYTIYDKDEGFSGKNINRPSYLAMMEDVRHKRLDVVIVYKLDRISRNVQDFSSTFTILQEHGVAFVSVKESFDTSTPIGRTVMYILAAFAQLERENTVERVSDSMRDLAIMGKWTGGHCPTGMKSIKKEIDGKEHSYLMVDDGKIQAVKIIYELLLSGYAITALERYCRDHCMKSQNGKFLGTSQLYAILTNPVYCQNSREAYDYLKGLGCTLPDRKLFDGRLGLMGYGKSKTGKTSQSKQPMDKWVIAIGMHDYVISGDKWIAAQKRLGRNKQIRTAKYELGLLKGVLKCSCGASMINRVYVKGGKLFAYYTCSDRSRKGKDYCDAKAVKISDIDQLFLEELKHIQIDLKFIKLNRGTMVPLICDSKQIREELVSLKKKIKNLTLLLQENLESDASKYIISQIEELDQKQNRLSLSLISSEKARQTADMQESNIDYIHGEICSLLIHFNELGYREKNELIKRIVLQCELNNRTLTISF